MSANKVLQVPGGADEPSSTGAYDVARPSRAAKGHVEEVRAFLRSSQEVLRQLSRSVESARARVLATDSRVERVVRQAERFTEAIQDAQAFLASVNELERIRADLERAAALLEREHAKFVDASQNNPVPTLITDRRSIVRDANSSAAAAFGVAEPALPGRCLIAFVARQDTGKFRAFSRTLWDDPGEDEREVVLRIRPRGRPVLLAKLSVHGVRGVTRSRIGLRWTIGLAEGATP